MEPDPVSVSPTISLRVLVEDYIYKYHFKMFPVVEGRELVGCVTTKDVKEVPPEDWERRNVGEIAARCTDKNTIAPDTDATEALAVMSKTGQSRLMIVERGRLVGVISLKDLLNFLSLKLDLEEKESFA
jgi:predicted transcriptional regulator